MNAAELREQRSRWLEQIIRGNMTAGTKAAIQLNPCRFSFRVTKMTKVLNLCTKSLAFQFECTCAYEHEYFQYVNEDGEINEEMFSKILSNVRVGRCPHAKAHRVLDETSVTAKHAFAAIGNTDMILPETTFVPTSCFGITPYHVATVHQQLPALQKLSNIYNFANIQYPTCIRENSEGFYFELIATNSLKLCIDRNDLRTLKTIIGGITHNYEYSPPMLYAIHHGKCAALEELLASYTEYHKIFRIYGCTEDQFHCSLTAVLSDQPEPLTLIMEYLNIDKAFYLEENFTLCDLAAALGHVACEDILVQWQDKHSSDEIHESVRMRRQELSPSSMPSPFCVILQKLKIHNLRQFKTEKLCRVLQKLASNGNDINQAFQGKTALQLVCSPDPFFNILVAFTILELGGDVNVKDDKGETPLYYILHDLGIRKFYRKECLKALIGMILYQNPVRSFIEHWNIFDNPEKFQSLESISEGLSQNFLDSGYLPRGYTNMQSLQNICRTSIRQAFPGLALHKLVTKATLPASIRDFILMTNQLSWQDHLVSHSTDLK